MEVATDLITIQTQTAIEYLLQKNRRLAIDNEEKRQIAAAKHALEHPGGNDAVSYCH